MAAADDALADDALAAFSGAIGVIGVKGDFGRRAEGLYSEMLLAKHRRRGAGHAAEPGAGYEAL